MEEVQRLVPLKKALFQTAASLPRKLTFLVYTLTKSHYISSGLTSKFNTKILTDAKDGTDKASKRVKEELFENLDKGWCVWSFSNNLTDSDIQLISKELKVNKIFTLLKLACNNLTDE